MKKVTYKNRYEDDIVFEQTSSKTIKMSGYAPYYRIGWPNNYEIAYFTYLEDQQGVNDDPLFPEEFNKKLFEGEWSNPDKNPLHKYLLLVTANKDVINMFDPSGGPYIALGTDLSTFWGDKKPRIVKKIEFINKGISVKFTIK